MATASLTINNRSVGSLHHYVVGPGFSVQPLPPGQPSTLSPGLNTVAIEAAPPMRINAPAGWIQFLREVPCGPSPFGYPRAAGASSRNPQQAYPAFGFDFSTNIAWSAMKVRLGAQVPRPRGEQFYAHNRNVWNDGYTNADPNADKPDPNESLEANAYTTILRAQAAREKAAGRLPDTAGTSPTAGHADFVGFDTASKDDSCGTSRNDGIVGTGGHDSLPGGYGADRLRLEQNRRQSHALLQGDLDGNGTGDFEAMLMGPVLFSASNLILPDHLQISPAVATSRGASPLPRRPMASFTLMCWNVENLFLPEDGATEQVRARFDAKLATLAGVIDGQRPDVLALQEVGPDGALQALQAALTHPLPHGVEGEPDGRGIRVAFLSRHPFSTTRSIVAFPEMIHPVQARDPVFDDPATPADESLTGTLGRGALEVVVEIEGHPVRIITAHFKSKLISYARQKGLVEGSQFAPNDENERYRYAAYGLYRRTTEAVTLRDRVNQILSGCAGSPDSQEGLGRQKAVVVCGDLNDATDAATTQILQGPSGSELGTEGFRRGDKGDGYRLWNLAPILNAGPNGDPPSEAPFSRRFQGRGELIDHILASHRLVNPGNIPVARTVLTGGHLPSISETPADRATDAGSDHAALVAEFEI